LSSTEKWPSDLTPPKIDYNFLRFAREVTGCEDQFEARLRFHTIADQIRYLETDLAPPQIKYLINLETLYLRGEPKEPLDIHFPEGLDKIKTLKIIRIAFTTIRAIGELPDGLKSLTLTNSKLEEVPHFYCELTELDLSYNPFTAIFQLPKSLETGTFVHCENLESLPSRLPPQMKILSLNSSRVSRIPHSKTLTFLDITRAPCKISAERFPALKKLFCSSHNHIQLSDGSVFCN